MKTTTKAARTDSKRVTISLLPKLHARVMRAAPAHRVSNNRYAQMALEFMLDCEDAFGGPMTEQFRTMTVRNLKKTQEKLQKFFSDE